jgi:hypothetical protein
MEEMELPTLKNGEVVNDLGKYMTELLGNFKKTFRISQSWYIYWTRWNYSSGGHGIGSISNVFGECKIAPYIGQRYIDMFKNKIISDLSNGFYLI